MSQVEAQVRIGPFGIVSAGSLSNLSIGVTKSFLASTASGGVPKRYVPMVRSRPLGAASEYNSLSVSARLEGSSSSDLFLTVQK